MNDDKNKIKISIKNMQPQNLLCCKRNKMYRNNLDEISNKLLSIDFIWKILLKHEYVNNNIQNK
jgi:hypothetical protein